MATEREWIERAKLYEVLANEYREGGEIDLAEHYDKKSEACLASSRDATTGEPSDSKKQP